jgi:hypothetical protein
VRTFLRGLRGTLSLAALWAAVWLPAGIILGFVLDWAEQKYGEYRDHTQEIVLLHRRRSVGVLRYDAQNGEYSGGVTPLSRR